MCYMVLIQIDMPIELNKNIAKKAIDMELNKHDTIVGILEKYFN